MNITAQSGKVLGVTVEGFAGEEASAADVAALKEAVYAAKIAVVKGQELTPERFLALGRRLGRRADHHLPVYCQAGKFWHSNRHLTTAPFDLSLSYPREVPTYFIDMAAAYERLPNDLKFEVRYATATYGVLRYAELGPREKGQKLADIVDLVNGRTPPVTGPAVDRHPRTGETVLHISEGFTLALQDTDGADRPDLLAALLEATGQLDPTYQHENIHLQAFEKGDLLVWDNHSLVHRAAHAVVPEPVVSVYDE
ncbi:TauD/TfdA dioxygenase family protein [Actinophytocola sp.]|uniref:TauD/TfdA dioxygenase family protein n=1 Tax=Actinophytocola sp. TaxID=1872138 RepID=UPI00389AE486